MLMMNCYMGHKMVVTFQAFYFCGKYTVLSSKPRLVRNVDLLGISCFSFMQLDIVMQQ